MSSHGPAPTAFYRPAEVAKVLRCSEWWVKEQARKRRIPFCWIGGSYLFTDAHIAEIVRRFEVQPTDTAASSTVARLPTPHRAADNGDAPTALRARTPRRAREAGKSRSFAA